MFQIALTSILFSLISLTSTAQPANLTYAPLFLVQLSPQVDCGATLGRFEDQPLDTHVLVFSAGHCYSRSEPVHLLFPDVGPLQIPREQGLKAPWGVCHDNLFDCFENQQILPSEFESMFWQELELNYVNNHNRMDLAIGRLPMTYEELASRYGLQAPIIQQTPPQQSDEYYFVRRNQQVAQCRFLEIRDSPSSTNTDFDVFIEDALITGHCRAEPGDSGGPLFSKANHRLAGILAMAGEVLSTAVVQRLDQTRACFDESFNLDLGRPGCPIPRPEIVDREDP